MTSLLCGAGIKNPYPFTEEQNSRFAFQKTDVWGFTSLGAKAGLSAAKVIIFLNYDCFASCRVSRRRPDLAEDSQQSL